MSEKPPPEKVSPAKITNGALETLVFETIGKPIIFAVALGMLWEIGTDPMYIVLISIAMIIGLPLFFFTAYERHAHEGEPKISFCRKLLVEIYIHATAFITHAVEKNFDKMRSVRAAAAAKQKKRTGWKK